MARFGNLIQTHIKRHELISRALLPKKKPKIKPVITFSREAGSGGRLIAQIVSKKLAYEYYDRNLINLISRESKLEKEIVLSLDEQKEGTLAAIIKKLFGKEPLPAQAYIRALSHTVLAIAEKGSAVIVGRGANFIIPAKKRLAVRIIAPLSVRIKNNIAYDNRTEEEARESIRRIHFNRKKFVTKYFSKDIGNANYYDLIINTKDISINEAVELALSIYRSYFKC